MPRDSTKGRAGSDCQIRPARPLGSIRELMAAKSGRLQQSLPRTAACDPLNVLLALHWGMSGNMARARALLLIVAALGTIGCDRITKHVATAYLAGTPDRSFLSNTIRVGYVENTGGFLSLGADLPPIARDAVFTVATGIALMALLGLTLRRKYTGPAELGLVLFVAGGASNWIDRVLRGSVVDFLNMGIGPLRTGVFNMADVAIMLGAALFVLGELGWNQKRVNNA